MLGVLLVALVVGAQSARDLWVSGLVVLPILLAGLLMRGALRTIAGSGGRSPMVISGGIVATMVIASFMGGELGVLLPGLPGLLAALLVYLGFLGLGVPRRADLVLAVVMAAVFWAVNTAILGALLARVRPRRMPQKHEAT